MYIYININNKEKTIGRFTYQREIDSFVDRQIGRQVNRQVGRQVDRQIGGQVGWWKDKYR